MRKRARKGRKLHTEGVQNRRFWHAFGSFRRETKGTPGVGRVGPPMGGAQRGSTGGAAPSQNLPGDLQETASYGILIQIYQSDKSTRNRKGRNG